MMKKQSIFKKPKSVSSYSLNKIFKVYSCSDRKPPPLSKPSLHHHPSKNSKKKIKSTYLQIKHHFQTHTKNHKNHKNTYLTIDQPPSANQQKNHMQVPLSYRVAETVDVEICEQWKKKKGMVVCGQEGIREKKGMRCKIIRCSKIPFRIERRSKRDSKLEQLFYRTEQISGIEYRESENSMSSKSNILLQW